MRLLSVNNYYYGRGGADIVFLRHNELFKNRNWNIIPFSMNHRNNFESEWAEYFVKEIEYGEKYEFLEQIVNVTNSIYSFDARRKLNALIRRTSPEICHCHNIYHHISPSILSLLRKNKIPTVITLHDLKIACPSYSMLSHDGICERCKENKILNVIIHRCMKNSLGLSAVVFFESLLHRILNTYKKYVNKFIVPSKFYLNKFAEWGFDPKSFSYVPNFIDVHKFVPEYNPGKKFIYFGRLSKEKGLITLFKAAAEINASLVIVGTGPLEIGLRKLAFDKNIDAEFTGYLTGKKLHDAIGSARAFILPSEWYENAPLSIMEAYAMGKPVIGSSIGGIPELIQDGKTGVTFECASVGSLVEKMKDFAEMKDQRVKVMGRNGRAWAESSFNEDVYYQKVIEVYKTI